MLTAVFEPGITVAFQLFLALIVFGGALVAPESPVLLGISLSRGPLAGVGLAIVGEVTFSDKCGGGSLRASVLQMSVPQGE
jgi:hypothetical protein